MIHWKCMHMLHSFIIEDCIVHSAVWSILQMVYTYMSYNELINCYWFQKLLFTCYYHAIFSQCVSFFFQLPRGMHAPSFSALRFQIEMIFYLYIIVRKNYNNNCVTVFMCKILVMLIKFDNLDIYGVFIKKIELFINDIFWEWWFIFLSINV
jgi:hypothetical protein